MNVTYTELRNVYVILNYIYLLSNKIKPAMSESKNIINTTPAELDKIIKDLKNNIIFKVALGIIIIIPIILKDVYPELLSRTIVVVTIIIAAIFGFAPNETLCNNGLGCHSKFVTILISILLYIFAVYIAYKTNII